MEKYYKRKAPELDSANNSRNPCPYDINWEEEIKYDPGLRKEIDAYHPNHREKASGILELDHIFWILLCQPSFIHDKHCYHEVTNIIFVLVNGKHCYRYFEFLDFF